MLVHLPTLRGTAPGHQYAVAECLSRALLPDVLARFLYSLYICNAKTQGQAQVPEQSARITARNKKHARTLRLVYRRCWHFTWGGNDPVARLRLSSHHAFIIYCGCLAG